MPSSGRFRLGTFEEFASHEWVSSIVQQRFSRDALLAYYARATLLKDLEELNNEYLQAHNRVAFTTTEGRVKTEESFLRKLYKLCSQSVQKRGMTRKTLHELYDTVNDICGVRFSCPYLDEVEPAVTDIVRGRLVELGYAVDVRSEPGCGDRDYLDKGDEFGYRAYHFFLKVPTVIDIYNNVELYLCEVQARTELQHVWAVKSHDLLYKPITGWDLPGNDVVEDMRQVSNSLRAADQFLISIRNRVRKGAGDDS